jgi:hypothetical protein
MTTETQLHRYSVRRHTPIRAAAFVERLCFQVGDDPYRETYEACVHETLANALRRINAPTDGIQAAAVFTTIRAKSP